MQKLTDLREQGLFPNLDPQEYNTYAIVQSRFFMYDLIKITSRKTTTKIITFYYRIPKLDEYDVAALETDQLIHSLNKKPLCHYQFAFKRKEFEEVSMSFEFEKEEDAKECISSVSSLYKKLKDQQKRKARRPQDQTQTPLPTTQGGPTPGGSDTAASKKGDEKFGPKTWSELLKK